MGYNNRARLGARRFAALLAALGALVMSSGIALMVTATPANAAVADCVPAEAWTETTDWVDESPGEGWTQVDSRVKTPAEPAHWDNLVWHNYTGKQPDAAPPLDDPKWHALPADPNAATHSVPPRVPNVPYNVSTGPHGKGSWFLWTGDWVPATDAVYEFKFAFEHPAVTCEQPVLCPEGTDKAGQEVPKGQTAEEFCDDPAPVCPEGSDKAGQEIPEGQTAEEFCDDEESPVLCPEGSDKAGQEIPEGQTAEEFCDNPETPRELTPEPPTFTDPTCVADPSVELPAQAPIEGPDDVVIDGPARQALGPVLDTADVAGIHYEASGDLVPGGTVEVVATLIDPENTVFADGVETSWSHTFSVPTGCESVTPPPAETGTETTVVSTPQAGGVVTPTLVDAGLGEDLVEGARANQGLALMVAGMVMLVAAGGLGLVRPRA